MFCNTVDDGLPSLCLERCHQSPRSFVLLLIGVWFTSPVSLCVTQSSLVEQNQYMHVLQKEIYWNDWNDRRLHDPEMPYIPWRSRKPVPLLSKKLKVSTIPDMRTQNLLEVADTESMLKGEIISSLMWKGEGSQETEPLVQQERISNVWTFSVHIQPTNCVTHIHR